MTLGEKICRCPKCKHNSIPECELSKDPEDESKTNYCSCCMVLRVMPECGCIHADHDEHSGSIWPSGEQMYPARPVKEVLIE